MEEEEFEDVPLLKAFSKVLQKDWTQKDYEEYEAYEKNFRKLLGLPDVEPEDI
jgi:hypothetical protein